MAHESFEDPASAAVMNELFVNIKVDREERPDLDKIYQLAQQMLTQRSGGWPLTMFLTPGTQRPFFGGTYFPKEPRYGMPAFTDLLRRVSEFYRTHREDIAKQSEALQQAFAEMSPPAAPADAPLDARTARRRRARSSPRSSIAQFGGFGAAPKFPHPTNIEFLLRQWRATAASDAPDLHSLYMATLTLQAHGRRRHLRPSRRRLRALFGRPVLDDPALREDAVRQRSAAAHLRQRGARDRRRAVPSRR